MSKKKSLEGVVYTDTDSLITQFPLDPHEVGIGIGQMKLECCVQRGYFPAPKVYYIQSAAGPIIKRAKGVGALDDEPDYINLTQGHGVSVNVER